MACVASMLIGRGTDARDINVTSRAEKMAKRGSLKREGRDKNLGWRQVVAGIPKGLSSTEPYKERKQ